MNGRLVRISPFCLARRSYCHTAKEWSKHDIWPKRRATDVMMVASARELGGLLLNVDPQCMCVYATVVAYMQIRE